MLVAVALALVALATAAVVLLLPDDEQVRRSALAAARERTTDLTSYDHRRLDEDVAVVQKTATGDFEREYEQTIARLRATLERTQAVATAEVVGAGLESLSSDAGTDRAVVVVAVDQTIRTAGAAARVERNRLRMTLVRPADTWLVERVDRL